MDEKIRIDFLTKILLKRLQDKDGTSATEILEICRSEPFLPNNQTDAYHYINKLKMLNILKRIRRGVYEINKKNLKGALDESK